MNKITLNLLLLLSLLSTAAHAAEIVDGRFNVETLKVELSVVCEEGCTSDSIKLEFDNYCRESFPVSCTLRLVQMDDEIDSSIETKVHHDLEFELPEILFTDDYFTRASMLVLGSGGTKFSFNLPETNDPVLEFIKQFLRLTNGEQ